MNKKVYKYDRWGIQLPSGLKNEVKIAAIKKGLNIADYIDLAIKNQMSRDGIKGGLK